MTITQAAHHTREQRQPRGYDMAATVTLPLFTRVGNGELIEIGTFDIPITVGEGVKTEILRGVREATSIDTDTIKDGHGHTVRTYVEG